MWRSLQLAPLRHRLSHEEPSDGSVSRTVHLEMSNKGACDMTRHLESTVASLFKTLLGPCLTHSPLLALLGTSPAFPAITLADVTFALPASPLPLLCRPPTCPQPRSCGPRMLPEGSDPVAMCSLDRDLTGLPCRRHLEPPNTWHLVTVTPPYPPSSTPDAADDRHLQRPLPSLGAHALGLPSRCEPWAPSVLLCRPALSHPVSGPGPALCHQTSCPPAGSQHCVPCPVTAPGKPSAS